jgi:spermidine synthase
MGIKRSTGIAIITLGATSIASQIVALRELIVVFYGNELSIGLMLSAWLLFGAAGSLIAGISKEPSHLRIPIFCACQMLLSAALPLSILLIRYIKTATGYLPGEIVPISAIALAIPCVVGPICLATGFMFGLACKTYQPAAQASGIGRVYMLESAGAVAGGLIVSLFLVNYIRPLEIMGGLGILNISACIALISSNNGHKLNKPIRSASMICLIIFFALFISGALEKIGSLSKESAWRPFKLIASRDSIYGNVAVTEKGGQISFFSNGVHNFSVPDKLSQEEGIHYALLQHSAPKDLLLIGGGAGGILWEALKHPLRTLDYVELDPLIIELSREFLSGSPYYALDDPRVNILNTDGRSFIMRLSKKYDVVAVNIPDPYTAQFNRFYTKEFFLQARDALKDGGILSFGVTSSENYISAELGEFLGSIYRTLSTAFEHIELVPGDTAYFLASEMPGALSRGYPAISRRLKERGIETGFVNEGYLFSKLSEDRLDYMQDSLEKAAKTSINEDFKPISYYYDIILWSRHFTGIMPRLMTRLTAGHLWSAFALLSLGIIILGAGLRKRGSRLSSLALTAVGATGFSEITFEIIVILSFQIMYGFLYYKLGLILTAFMLGLFAGSAYVAKRLDRITAPIRPLTNIQAAATIYPLLLPLIFSGLSGEKSALFAWVGSNIIFPMLPLIAGFIGGLQFPIAAKLYIKEGGSAAKAGGAAYAADLAGACVGAAFVSSVVVPMVGVYGTCLAVALLNFSAFLALLMNRRRGEE